MLINGLIIKVMRRVSLSFEGCRVLWRFEGRINCGEGVRVVPSKTVGHTRWMYVAPPCIHFKKGESGRESGKKGSMGQGTGRWITLMAVFSACAVLSSI